MVVRINDKKKNYGKVTKLLVKPKLIPFSNACSITLFVATQQTPIFYIS